MIHITVNCVPVLLCDVYYYVKYSIFKNTLRCSCGGGGDDERALLLISTTAAQRQFETLVKRANGSAFVSGVMTVYIIHVCICTSIYYYIHYTCVGIYVHTHTHTHARILIINVYTAHHVNEYEK